MGNSFIGFPVPRARIADMIAGSAPPSEHKSQHQDGGTDEMDLTGLIGAGGEGFPLRGLWIDDFSLDHPRYYTSFTGGGELTRSYNKLTLRSTTFRPSDAEIYGIIRQPVPALTWDKKRHLLFQCYLDIDDRSNMYIWIAFGNASGDNYIGFQLWDSDLITMNRNAGGTRQTVVTTWTDGFIGEDIVLEAIHFPGEKVEFWVNRVLVHTETSRVPAGTTDAEYTFYLYVGNNNTENNVQMDFSHIQVFQAG